MTNLSIFTKNSSTKQNNSLPQKISFSLEQRFKDLAKKRRLTKPYQVFGIWIAQNLGDTKNIPLFIKLAKNQDKILLESAVSYVKDYPNARSRTHLFLWFLKGKLKKIDKSINQQIDKKKRENKKNLKKEKFNKVELIDDAVIPSRVEGSGSSKLNKLQSEAKNQILNKSSFSTQTFQDDKLIEDFFSKSKIEKPEQITDPKKYLFEKLSTTKKYSNKLQENFYSGIYKFDIYSNDYNFVIDIIDERDQNLAKKNYFEAKKTFAFQNKIKYYIFDADEITGSVIKVLKRIG